MPELPEVETVRRGLTPVLEGARLGGVRINRPDLRFPFPDRFVDRLEGATVERIDRRAKYLLMPLSTGETWVTHLGMTGRFTLDGRQRDQRARTKPGVRRRHRVNLHLEPGRKSGGIDQVGRDPGHACRVRADDLGVRLSGCADHRIQPVDRQPDAAKLTPEPAVQVDETQVQTRGRGDGAAKRGARGHAGSPVLEGPPY